MDLVEKLALTKDDIRFFCVELKVALSVAGFCLKEPAH